MFGIEEKIFYIVIAIIISMTIMGGIAFCKTEKGGSKSFGLLMLRGLKFYTVMIIVVASVFLAMEDKITSQGIIGILSSIAAFVLGTSSKSNNIKENKNGDEN